MARTSNVCLAVVLGLGTANTAFAQTAPSLGGAQSFAVLGASTVTNTGSSVISGNVGASPGNSITGFPPGLVVNGVIHAGNATSLAAQTSAMAAYTTLAGQACTQDLSGQDLGGLTLTPGVYCFSGSAQLTGTLTLNAQGNASAVFVFKIGSTLTTASASRVLVINGGSLCNLFWQVGSSATLGTATSFAGNIIALASVTVTTGASLTGRALALNGAVTLDTNSILVACANGPPTGGGCPAIAINPLAMPNGTVGAAFSESIIASGGVAPYAFGVTAGTLPPGLTLAPSGLLSGTPTIAATSTFTIRGTDANGCFAERVYTMTITTAVPTLPEVFVGLLALALMAIGYLRLRRRSGPSGPVSA
jgi:type VI secretion system secreted protein VgrG